MTEQIEAPQAITIVSGLPRSGTSMMMQMLVAGGLPVLTDNIRRPDTDNPKGYFELEAVKRVRDDASWIQKARGKVVKLVYRLLYDLPSDQTYNVVFMRRRLEEVIASQEEMLQRNGKESGDVDPETLARIYGRHLREASSWLRSQSNFDVLYVDYQDVLERPDQVANQLNTFVGGNLDTDAMLQVPDRTLYRNRR